MPLGSGESKVCQPGSPTGRERVGIILPPSGNDSDVPADTGGGDIRYESLAF
jgi:hypothetical protein